MAIRPSILTNNYVKFVRTTLSLWNALLNKDPDTLYFVLDENSKTGSLYLGSTLIAAGLDKGLSIEELTDVVITGDVLNNQILVANGKGVWQNRNINDFMPITMVGASSDQDGDGGLVPAPKQGQQGLYLRGDGNWADPTVELAATVGSLSSTLEDVKNNVETVIGGDWDKTMRAVAKDEATKAMTSVVDGAPAAFDTLKEIAAWIAGADGEVAVDAETLISDVANLKELVSAENTGLVTKVGTLEGEVDTLQQEVEALTQTVGGDTFGLVKQVNDNTTAINENADAIAEVDSRLKWNELIDDTTTT